MGRLMDDLAGELGCLRLAVAPAEDALHAGQPAIAKLHP